MQDIENQHIEGFRGLCFVCLLGRLAREDTWHDVKI